MRSRTWLVTGLVCALGASGAAQPAAPAAKAKAGTRGKKAGKAAKAAPVDLAPVITALSGAATEAAVQAAGTLGASAEPAAHDALLDALAMGLPTPVAVAALGALAAHPAPPDVAALQRYARYRNPQVRIAALTALVVYPAADAKKTIIAGLGDENSAVRTSAALAIARGKLKEGIEALFALLARGDEAAIKGLAAMADVDLARRIGDQFGQVPEGVLATTLGAILVRPDFGPDPARVDLVRALGKIQDSKATDALSSYVDGTPKSPPRPSRDEAQKMVQARLGGGGK